MQTKNLLDYAEGKVPEVQVDPKAWEITLKIAKDLPNLQMLDKVLNGEIILPEPKEEEQAPTEAIVKPISDANPFESRSAAIKEKLNGTTHK